jgi:hypothetical protein
MDVDTTHVRNRLLYACLEFLYENPLTDAIEDYQLFHESLREYLSKTYPTELKKCIERICDWSIGWTSENGDYAFGNELLSYAMHYSAEHLFESYTSHLQSGQKNTAANRKEQLFALVENQQWRSLNFETSGNGEALGKSYYFLQRILAKEDTNGNRFQDFIKYAYNRYDEPQKMYISQRDTLMQPVGRNKLSALFERTPSLAKMGERDEDKVLLALLPLWVNECQSEIPLQLQEKIQDWLENTRSTAVKKLWQQTKSKLS